LDSRPQNAVSRAVRLKKDKAKSTAFLVAQFSPFSAGKFRSDARHAAQITEK
jgi:hypothetical protein